MTEVQAVEQGVLRAVGKIFLIIALVGILILVVRSAYMNSEAYQDERAQNELIEKLGGTR